MKVPRLAERMDEASKNRIVNGLAALSASASQGGGNRPAGVRSTHAERQTAAMANMRRDAAVLAALRTQAGLRRIAANMANPVRDQLDYRGIYRQFVIVEQMPDGVPLIFDRDQPDVPAVVIGNQGTARVIEMTGIRTEVTPYETSARPKVPYAELYTRRYRALDRARERLIEGMQLREDLIGFGLIDTAARATNTVITVAGKASKSEFAKVFTQVEANRLVVTSVLMSAFGTQEIRKFPFQDLDQLGMQEVRESGYLGRLWGADFYVSDQIASGSIFALTSPKFLGWYPIRKDTDVIPADDPDNLQLGFVGYQFNGNVIHNTKGAALLEFTINQS